MLEDNKMNAYKNAGVDISKGNMFSRFAVHSGTITLKNEVIGNRHGFAGLFKVPLGYNSPVLAASTDGVGTKVKIAVEQAIHYDNPKYLKTIGHDVVAMVINDIICTRADPLFFLDYLATSKIDFSLHKQVIVGITDALVECDTTLLGGETAEMPGMYNNQDFDLAGFGVGIVEEENIFKNDDIKENDIIIGITSSGPHANGYSLIRTILDTTNVDSQILEQLMQPTTLYHNAIKCVRDIVNGIAHITGGGLIENIPRIVDQSLTTMIKQHSWQIPSIFDWIQCNGNVSKLEMYRVFNMGIGMVLFVDPSEAKFIHHELRKVGYDAFIIGRVVPFDGQSVIINEK